MSNCLNCSKEIESHTGRRPKKFCSDTCRQSFHNKKKEGNYVKKTTYEAILNENTTLKEELAILRQKKAQPTPPNTKTPKQEERVANEPKISSGDISKLKKERDELINEMSNLGDNGIDKALKSSIQSRINQINSKIGD